MYAFKRDQYRLQRDMSTLKRDIHTRGRCPWKRGIVVVFVTCGGNIYMHPKENSTNSTETDIHSKETYKLPNETYTHPQETYMNSKKINLLPIKSCKH